jgi:halimadienyl-diphosphate synthase
MGNDQPRVAPREKVDSRSRSEPDAGNSHQQIAGSNGHRASRWHADGLGSERVLADLLRKEVRPGIAGTAYDTAWLASVPANGEGSGPRFPDALQWLVDNQLPDGSWGGSIRYEHDRVLCTLAALVPLVKFASFREADSSVAAGTRYLWQRGHALSSEPTELVAFELLLPAMIRRAQAAGLKIPPHLDIYATQRAEKMNLIPAGALYSPRVTVVHSLEFLGDRVDLNGMKAAQGSNGSIGNSPAATAFYCTLVDDQDAHAYLERCMAHSGDSTVPVLYPCETYELLWTAYHLHLAGASASQMLSNEERLLLEHGLSNGGVSLSPSFPIPDADDTAVALLLLQDLGELHSPAVLKGFALEAGNFASFKYERHASVGVSLHVLHALLRVPGYPRQKRTVERLLDYLSSQQIGGLYWQDKWHISPYYATAHAVSVLRELPAEHLYRMKPLIDKSMGWLRQTQNGDGSWGFYGQTTAEETAYALLTMATAGGAAVSEEDKNRCIAAASYLQDRLREQSGEHSYPPLWIDKCLYTPTLVVQAVIEAALAAFARLSRQSQRGGR